jgi:tetratricopeptide (TPR) repeat protein
MKRVLGIWVVIAASFALSGCKTKQGYVTTGNKLFEAGKYADASINYRNALQKDPEFGEAHYRLGLVALKQGDARLAYTELSRAVELLTGNDDAKKKLGDLCLKAYLADARRPVALYNRTAQLAEQLLAKNGSSFEGLKFKGYLALTDRKPEEAIALFRKALQAKPSEPNLTTVLAQTMHQNGQSQEAETLALNLIAHDKTYGPIYDVLYAWYFDAKRFAEAENILKTKASNNPKQADYILQLALHYYRAHKVEEMNSTLQRMLDDPKDFPKAQLQAGDFYMRIRDFPEAALHYQEAGRDNPQDSIVSRKRITDALLAQGKKEEALGIAEQILKEHPTDEEARRVRANLWLDSRKPENVDKALSDLQALTKLHPEDAALWFRMGEGNVLRGDLDAVRSQFQEAVARRKDFVQARYQLAAISLSQQRASDALQQTSEILKTQPKDPRVRMLHALALNGTGNQAQARAEFTQLVNEFPQYREPRLGLGLLAISQKKYQEAEEIFTKLGARDPRAAAGLAATSSAERQFQKAIGLLNGALEKSPDSLMLREQLASTAAAAGQYDLSIAEFKKLVAGQPKSIVFRVRLGEIYEFKGDHANAMAVYREAQTISPNDATPTFLLAISLAKAGRRGEAKAQYESLLKSHPDNFAAMNNLAFLLAETGGDLDQALSLAQRAVQKFPGQPEFSDTIGYVYLKKKMPDSAVRSFDSLVDKYPNNPTYRYHLGMALLETGDKAGARKELEEALANHPSEDQAAKIRELVTKIG